jgi:hypothetical protein
MSVASPSESSGGRGKKRSGSGRQTRSVSVVRAARQARKSERRAPKLQAIKAFTTFPFSDAALFRHIGHMGDYVAHAKSHGDLVVLVRTAERDGDEVFQVYHNHRSGKGRVVVKLGEFMSQRKLAVNRFASLLAELHICYTKVNVEPLTLRGRRRS